MKTTIFDNYFYDEGGYYSEENTKLIYIPLENILCWEETIIDEFALDHSFTCTEITVGCIGSASSISIFVSETCEEIIDMF